MRTGRGLLVTQVRGLLREKMAGRGDRWSRDEKRSDVFRRVLFLHFPGSLKTRIDSSGCLTHETPGSWLTVRRHIFFESISLHFCLCCWLSLLSHEKLWNAEKCYLRLTFTVADFRTV